MTKYKGFAVLLVGVAAGVQPTLAQFRDITFNLINTSTYTSTTGSGGAYIYFETNAWLYDSVSGTTWANGGSTNGSPTSSNAAFIASINGNPVTMNWNNQTGNDALYFSNPININELSSGIDVTYAAASRVYVSLGSTFAVTGSGGILGEIGTGNNRAGAPNATALSDPNFNVRWDVFELTYEGGTNSQDQMDLTAINMTAVPMRLENFTGTATSGPTRTKQQTGQTAVSTNSGNDYNTLLTNMQTLAGSGTSNNASNWDSLPTNWYVLGSNTGGTAAPGSEFLRMIGPNAASSIGAQTNITGTTSGTVNMEMFPIPVTGTVNSSTLGLGAQAVIGPYFDFAEYIDYVHANTFYTIISDTIANNGNTYSWSGTLQTVAFTGGSYSATWGNATEIVTGYMYYAAGTNNAIQWESQITRNGTNAGTLEIIIPEAADVVAGSSSFTNYLRSKIIYDGSADSYGVMFVFTDTLGASTTFFDFNAVNDLLGGDMKSVQAQIFHDLTSAFQFGLIGNTNTITLNGTTQSLSDWGSEGWRIMENSGTAFNMFSGTLAMINDFFNQWAAQIYGSSDDIYGSVYSDFFQKVLLQSSELNGDDITSWDLTILPDVVPEASTVSLMVIGGGLLWAGMRRRNGNSLPKS